MDYKDLQIIKEIWSTQNITKAANNLFITQPTLTYRIQRIEKELGIKIVERKPKGIVFTAQGDFLAHYAISALEDWKQLQTALQKISNNTPSILNMGVSTVIAKLKLAPMLKSFRDAYPLVQINLHPGSSTLQLPQMLKQDTIQIAIIRGEPNWNGPQITLAEEPYCLVSNHPLTLEELPNQAWIRYKASRITKSEKLQEAWWLEHFPTPHNNVIHMDSIEASIEMVRYGLGWAIIPQIYKDQFQDLSYTPVLTAQNKPLIRKTVLAYRPEIDTDVNGHAFIEHILKYYKHK